MKTADPSQKIMNIRLANGGSALRCPTCARNAVSPYRRYDAAGAIVEGCIDAIHTEHLPSLSNTSAWHNRKEAVALRRATLAMLTR